MRVLTLFLFASAAIGVVAQEPIFRGSSEAVRVFATVTNRDGQLVSDLMRESFEIRDEGKPQPITIFDNTPQRIRLVVMLDVSGSMEGNLPLLRAASEQLFKRLRPDDVARVGTFGRRRGDQPALHQRRARAAGRAAPRHRPRGPHAVVAGGQPGPGRIRSPRRGALRRPGAQRRQGHRSDAVRRALLQPGRDHRPRAQGRRDDLRHRDAQPRRAAPHAGHRTRTDCRRH